MKLQNTVLTALGALALAATGCFGDLEPVDSPDPPAGGPDAGVQEPEADAAPTTEEEPGTAQALYEQNVAPIVQATCSPGGACHSAQDPAFVSASPIDAYAAIIAQRDRLFPGYDPATAKLLTKATGGHKGAVFSPTDVATIQAWLAAEKLEAEDGGDEASPLAIWSGCMDLGDWDLEDVASGWANKNAQGQGRCEACHNLGAEGFIASDQSTRVFDTVTQSPSFMASYFTLDDTGTNVIINRARLENVGNQLAPYQEHGGFDVDGTAMERLVRFYDRTMARKAAGLCQPPRFPQQ